MKDSASVRVSEAPLIDHGRITERIRELADAISRDLAGREPILLIVLKGGVFVGAELASRMTVPVRLEFVCARSYQGTTSSGAVALGGLPDFSGRDVVVVEDILDTGRTLAALLARLRAQGPASIRVCTLLDKPARREVDVEADYVGFTIADAFVVGYGLDYEERYRTLPSIHVLERD